MLDRGRASLDLKYAYTTTFILQQSRYGRSKRARKKVVRQASCLARSIFAELVSAVQVRHVSSPTLFDCGARRIRYSQIPSVLSWRCSRCQRLGVCALAVISVLDAPAVQRLGCVCSIRWTPARVRANIQRERNRVCGERFVSCCSADLAL